MNIIKFKDFYLAKTILQNLRFLLVLAFLTLSLSTMLAQTTAKRALLVIDVQENLVNPNSKIHMDTAGIDLFFNKLNQTISTFDQGKDLVVYIVNEWTNPIMNWGTGNVCKKGAPGVGLDGRLKQVNQYVFSKSKPNSLTNAELLKLLKDNQITEVYVVGLLAEGCIKATVLGLQDEEFQPIVISDVIGSKNRGNYLKVMEYFEKNGIKMVQAKDIR